MFQKGELVIYGSIGICRVEEIGSPAACGIAEAKPHYTLAPLFLSGVIYTPVDTQVFMRPILTREQAEQLIARIPEIPGESTIGQSTRTLGETYKSLLRTHRCEDLVRLMKTIAHKEKALLRRGKKLAKTDLEYSKTARELLHHEVALALDIPYEQVQDYIDARLEKAVE